MASSYSTGDLGDVYAATRGAGVLGTVVLAGMFLHQHLSLVILGGVVEVSILVMVPAWRTRWSASTVLWTLSVAIAIAVYSTLDSHGVRLLSPISYIACQFPGAALVLMPLSLRQAEPINIAQASGAGLMSVISYVLILYAYQRAPAAPVLAMRQIGVALAPVLGWLILHERMRRGALWISLGIAVGSAVIVWG